MRPQNLGASKWKGLKCSFVCFIVLCSNFVVVVVVVVAMIWIISFVFKLLSFYCSFFKLIFFIFCYCLFGSGLLFTLFSFASKLPFSSFYKCFVLQISKVFFDKFFLQRFLIILNYHSKDVSKKKHWHVCVVFAVYSHVPHSSHVL